MTQNSSPLSRLWKIFTLLTFLPLGLLSHNAEAHVKWFSNYRYDEAPVDFGSLSHPVFWGLFLLSVVTISLLVGGEKLLLDWKPYRRFNSLLESYAPQATLILRIFTGASLLLAWQADAMIAPELKIPSQGAGWYQFGVALLLLFQVTTPVAGAAMIALFGYAATQYGIFHLLDYVVYLGIGIFLLISNVKKESLRELQVPALYLGLGFSLCWVALEKIFYPQWGLEALSHAPALTMGLEPSFFLLSCAFVEFSLGYMLVLGMLGRPLALTITLTFFTTTAFFGKTEVVGHTLLHGALLVFIVLGPGSYYRTPIAFHRKLWLRMVFAAVNFILLFALLAIPYHALSTRAFQHH